MVKYGGPRPVKATVSYPARAVNTTYTNNTGRPLLVIIGILSEVDAAADNAWASINVDTDDPPTSPIAYGGFVAKTGAGAQQASFSLIVCVPPGYKYRLNDFSSGTGSIAINKWTEVEL